MNNYYVVVVVDQIEMVDWKKKMNEVDYILELTFVSFSLLSSYLLFFFYYLMIHLLLLREKKKKEIGENKKHKI